jgi:hypothetical protein
MIENLLSDVSMLGNLSEIFRPIFYGREIANIMMKPLLEWADGIVDIK